MERFVSAFDDISSRELLEAIQFNDTAPLVPASFHNSMFDFDPLLQNPFYYGVGGNEQVDPAVPLFTANGIETSNLGNNTQWSNDLNQRSEGGTETRQPVYQRMRWNEDMIRVLITAVSYVEEDAVSHCLTTGKNNLLAPIKGKWRAISNAMTEKGHLVSPQQCEDKFNDLNKRYKRLNEIVGNGAAFELVHNPSLVDVLSICTEAKKEVRKLVGCKQLFYREMCSFHNKSREYLPHDESLKQTVQSALRGKVIYMSQDVGEPSKRLKGEGGTGVSGGFTLANTVGESTSFTLEAVEGLGDLGLLAKSRTGVSGGFTLANTVGESTSFTLEAVEGLEDQGLLMKSRFGVSGGFTLANTVGESSSFTLEAVEGLGDRGLLTKSRTGVSGGFTLANTVGESTSFTLEAVEGLEDQGLLMKSRTGISGGFTLANTVGESSSFTLEAVEGSGDWGLLMKSRTGVSGGFTLANTVGESTSITLEAVEGLEDQGLLMKSRSMQLEEKALLIENDMLELEKSRIEWAEWCENEDIEMDKMRLDNEVMRLENEVMRLENENKRLAYEIEFQRNGKP